MTVRYLSRGIVGGLAAAILVLMGVPLSASASAQVGLKGGGHTPFSGATESVCSQAPPGYASCLAEVIQPTGSSVPSFTRSSKVATPGSAAQTVTGLSPANIEGVYGFSTSLNAGSGMTVALVDAFNDPTAAQDLAAFSTEWGLPQCTTNSGCFTEVNQTGGSLLPTTTNNGWALETGLDIEWAHAIAPGADILLVEAKNASFANLMAADKYAGAHANYVSNSWGGGETSTETGFDADIDGSASYFVASGDSGGGEGVDYPAASPDVVAVGGTSLSFDSGGNLTAETAWSLGGGGCSSFEPAPAAQSSFAQYPQVGCSRRAVPDVALDADPKSGVAIYDSTPNNFGPNNTDCDWCVVGGTSVATPIWAAESAVAGLSVNPAVIYSSSSISYRDITQGNNGYAALVGYDLATGRGSWAIGAAGPPTGLTATGGGGQIALSWNPVGGATSYDIYRGTSANKLSTTPIATDVTGTTYPDTSVSGSKTYYYEVEGVNSMGDGSPSNEASGSPNGGGTGPLAAPTGLTATKRTARSVTLKWSGANGATSYDVLRGTTSGGETLLASGVTTLKYVDTGLNTSKTYYYEVEAVNGSDTSGPSNEVSITG